jgi:hypothetical protein
MADTTRTVHRFDDRAIRWRNFPGFDQLSFWVLGVNETRQKVDLLFRLAPWARCVPHRHVGPTDTLVLDGEHRTYAKTPTGWELDQVRPPGFFAGNEGDHVHVEEGGPGGAIVLLSMTAVDGLIWETQDDDGRVLTETSIDDFARALARQTSPAPAGG